MIDHFRRTELARKLNVPFDQGPEPQRTLFSGVVLSRWKQQHLIENPIVYLTANDFVQYPSYLRSRRHGYIFPLQSRLISRHGPLPKHRDRPLQAKVPDGRPFHLFVQWITNNVGAWEYLGKYERVSYSMVWLWYRMTRDEWWNLPPEVCDLPTVISVPLLSLAPRFLPPAHGTSPNTILLNFRLTHTIQTQTHIITLAELQGDPQPEFGNGERCLSALFLKFLQFDEGILRALLAAR
ncbi:hypothetical protein EW146_g389 [Bondarzewia mesenterica]|uniref:Uncharacterized protein n=1 Tax=Bondarzewia mesenterica TaxID=1095465 RepID=A0A4S4M7L3_9AGAM|nr:hypothetical protein EW146_g389 [Bondarzewia mesenterica]